MHFEKEKFKRLGIKRKGETSSSSEEKDEFPDDLPSSEKQRHMNPVNFINRAQELVMQQLISNANFDFSNKGQQKRNEPQDRPQRSNYEESKSKPRQEESRSKSKGKDIYGTAKAVQYKKQSIPSDYDPEEYEIEYEEEEEEVEETPPTVKDKKKSKNDKGAKDQSGVKQKTKKQFII